MVKASIVTFGLLALVAVAATPSSAVAQAFDQFACVSSGGAAGGGQIRLVTADQPCNENEVRRLVVVFESGPFISHPTRERSAFVSTIVATEATVRATGPLIFDTVIVADAHSAVPLTAESRAPLTVRCTPRIDGRRVGGVIHLDLSIASPDPGTGSRPTSPREVDAEPALASAPDILADSLARNSRVAAGRHTFDVVCESPMGVRFPGTISLVVLQ